jgi:hypothetical protein
MRGGRSTIRAQDDPVVADQGDRLHPTTAPRIMADVCWGRPSGFVDASFVDGWSTNDDWPETTPETSPGCSRRFRRWWTRSRARCGAGSRTSGPGH